MGERVMGSEFAQCMDTLKKLGVKFTVNWGPTKESWQKAILKAGYNVTAIACTVIEIGDTELLFCNSPLYWSDKEEGFGPPGLFMMRRDRKTGQVENRVLYGRDDNVNVTVTRTEGLAAVMLQYPRHFRQFEKRA